jgi:hypothetical protein
MLLHNSKTFSCLKEDTTRQNTDILYVSNCCDSTLIIYQWYEEPYIDSQLNKHNSTYVQFKYILIKFLPVNCITL